MFVFGEPDAAVQAATEMVTQALVQGLPPPHIGIHRGPVVFQDGDIYRSTVNIAARLSARAAPGEVLVSNPSPAASPSQAVWSWSGWSS
jgi:class 3 adenylate cyclase